MNSDEGGEEGDDGDEDNVSPDDISSAASEVNGNEDDKVDGDDDDIGDDPQWPLIAPIWLNVEKHPSEAFDEPKVINHNHHHWNDVAIKATTIY